MGVTIHLHKTHRQHTGGNQTVSVKGQTVGACLRDLVSKYPAMETVLFKPDGSLSHHIEIYLNMESAYPDELIKSVSDGDEIHLTLMLAGG